MAEASSAANQSEFLDDVVQALFGAGLRLENCLHMLDENSGNVRWEIETLIEGLHQLIQKIRLQAHGPAILDQARSSHPNEGEG